MSCMDEEDSVNFLLDCITDDREDLTQWPKPTMPRPTMEQFEEWCISPICQATDGCAISQDEVCEHGHPSWLLYLNII